MKITAYTCPICSNLYYGNDVYSFGWTREIIVLNADPEAYPRHICKGCVRLIRRQGILPAEDATS